MKKLGIMMGLLLLGAFTLSALLYLATVAPARTGTSRPAATTSVPEPIGPDAAARKKILSKLKPERDKFQEATFYTHPKTPVLGSQLALYIVEDKAGYALRLRATYEGEDRVFWKKLIVKAGDEIIALDAADLGVKRNNGSGRVWETLDVPVGSAPTGATKIIFRERVSHVFATIMANGPVSMRFQGERADDRDMGTAELERFREVGKKFMALYGVRD